MTDPQPSPEKQWWEAFPAPRAASPSITGEQLMKKFDDMDLEPKPRDFLLVDVRRTDWEVYLSPLSHACCENGKRERRQ